MAQPAPTLTAALTAWRVGPRCLPRQGPACRTEDRHQRGRRGRAGSLALVSACWALKSLPEGRGVPQSEPACRAPSQALATLAAGDTAPPAGSGAGSGGPRPRAACG